MASFDTSFDVTSDGNSDISDFVGFTEEDLVDNISILQDLDPNYSDIEVSSLGSMDISDFGESGDGTMNSDVDVPQEIVWTDNFRNVALDPFEKNSGPKLLVNFDTSTAKPLDYFELLFKPETFTEIATHTNNYALFKKDEMQAKKNDPNYEDHKWVNTSAPEIRALFGINIMMGINSLPQYKMYWHKDMFLGNDGIKRTMPISRYEKLTQYLHVSDRDSEP